MDNEKIIAGVIANIEYHQLEISNNLDKLRALITKPVKPKKVDKAMDEGMKFVIKTTRNRNK